MAQTTVKFKCNNCLDGIVKKVIKETATQIAISTKDCDKCGKSFGYKAIEGLRHIETV